MNALVTGGGGFLGTAVIRRLVERGWSVRSFCRRRYPHLESLGVEQMQGDLADEEAVSEAVREVDLVLHIGAKAGVWGKREDFIRANIEGTRNVLSACRRCGVRRLVYTSSPSVVFPAGDMEGATEDVPYPKSYRSHYPATKAVAERMVREAAGSDLATVSLRPHLLWGPGDTQLIPGILARGRTGRLRRIGREDKLVDFTYVDNAAEAHVLAAEKIEVGSPVSGKVYFISQGEPMPVWTFIARVLECASAPPLRPGAVPAGPAWLLGAAMEAIWKILPLPGEPPLTRFLVEELTTAHWFDISAAKRDLGYTPPVDMEEGFRRLADWFSRQPTVKS
ncbi:MAG TPA: NAD-dependent epimerase/dehydratase family protein [Acidobacteriota bacterium]|nr:NAD-dependent epimerase/dehydratase family protein [Acidobacteriota bacterium]